MSKNKQSKNSRTNARAETEQEIEGLDSREEEKFREMVEREMETEKSRGSHWNLEQFLGDEEGRLDMKRYLGWARVSPRYLELDENTAYRLEQKYQEMGMYESRKEFMEQLIDMAFKEEEEHFTEWKSRAESFVRDIDLDSYEVEGGFSPSSTEPSDAIVEVRTEKGEQYRGPALCD